MIKKNGLKYTSCGSAAAYHAKSTSNNVLCMAISMKYRHILYNCYVNVKVKSTMLHKRA